MDHSICNFRLQDILPHKAGPCVQLSNPITGGPLPGGPVEKALSWAKAQAGSPDGQFGLFEARKVATSRVRQANAGMVMWYAIYAYMVASITRVPDFWLQRLLSAFSNQIAEDVLKQQFEPNNPTGAFALVPTEIAAMAAMLPTWQLRRSAIAQWCVSVGHPQPDAPKLPSGIPATPANCDYWIACLARYFGENVGSFAMSLTKEPSPSSALEIGIDMALDWKAHVQPKFTAFPPWTQALTAAKVPAAAFGKWSYVGQLPFAIWASHANAKSAPQFPVDFHSVINGFCADLTPPVAAALGKVQAGTCTSALKALNAGNKVLKRDLTQADIAVAFADVSSACAEVDNAASTIRPQLFRNHVLQTWVKLRTATAVAITLGAPYPVARVNGQLGMWSFAEPFLLENSPSKYPTFVQQYPPNAALELCLWAHGTTETQPKLLAEFGGN